MHACLLCYVMLCYVMLCYVMLCYVMLCYVMLCYVMLCYVMLCYVMLCYKRTAIYSCYLADIDECDIITGTNDCAANATCTNGRGNYSCECPEGFEGDPKQGCTGKHKRGYWLIFCHWKNFILSD